MPSIARCMLSLAVVAILLTAPILTFNTGRHSREETASSYVVILDAGSSGTKINMYQISVNPTEPGDVTQVFSAVKVKPGLHTFLGDMDGLAEYAANIFNKLNAELNATATVSFQSPIHVDLLATAGLRSLEREDADSVLERAWRELNSRFQQSDYAFSLRHLNMLTGEEEGMYAFLAANFLKGSLKNATRPVGLLEMGGMSLQVVFPPEDPSQKNCELTVDGHVLQLYAHTYNEFGTSSVADKMMKRVCVRSASGTGPMDNPCMLREDCRPYRCGGEGSPETSVCGVGEPAQCTSNLTAVVDEGTASGVVNAGSTEFFAIGNFRYAPKTVGAIDPIDKNRVLRVSRLGKGAQVYCQKTLSEVTGGDKEKEKFASSECREALFILLLLKRLALADNTILIQDHMDGKKLDWALGFAVDKALPDVSIRCWLTQQEPGITRLPSDSHST